MKIEILISEKHFNLLMAISNYVKIEPKLLVKNIIESHLDNFDKEMEKIADVIYDDYYEDEEL